MSVFSNWRGVARSIAVVLGLAPLLGGCGLFSKPTYDVVCPTADIAGQLGSVSRFRGPDGNFANLAYHARLSDLQGTCEADDTGITVRLKVTLIGESGPAATEPTADFSYFVAVVNPRDRVVAKQMVNDTLTFSGSQHRGGAIDELAQRIPLGDPHESKGYHVLVGLQLSPEELAFNRAHGEAR